MSFHSSLMTALSADVVTALSISSSAVLNGRRKENVARQGVTVLIEPVDVEYEGQGGGHQLKAHRYRVHVMDRSKPEGNLVGTTKTNTVQGHLQTLQRLWDGAGFTNSSNLSGDLICMSAVIDEPDADKEDQETLDGSLLLTAVER